MKLKEYIEILSTFNPEVEVLKKKKLKSNRQQLVAIDKRDIIMPYMHFKYNPKTGREQLVDSFVLNP